MTEVRLFRAVSLIELDDIHRQNGAFRDSHHQTGEKAFFYRFESADDFAKSMQRVTGEAHVVVATEAQLAIVARGRAHVAAREGPGVYLRVSDFDLLTEAVEVSA